MLESLQVVLLLHILANILDGVLHSLLSVWADCFCVSCCSLRWRIHHSKYKNHVILSVMSLKKFSNYGADDAYRVKLLKCIEVLDEMSVKPD